MDRNKILGEGSIPRLLFTFSVPAIIGMMAQATYNFVDRIFVGRALGENGIAGTTVALPFMLVVLAFSMLVGFGAAALVSIRLGQQNREEAERVLGTAVTLSLALSAGLTAIGLVFLDPLLVLAGASEMVLPYARDYLQIIVAGTVFQVIGFGINAVIRGEGNPRIAMLTLLIGVVLNVFLAPLFIFELGWGMRGAAAATVLSQAVSAVWVLGHFLVGRRRVLHLHVRDLLPQWRLCTAILAIGSPPCLMQLAASVMNSILNNQLKTYGAQLPIAHGGDLAISVMGVIYAVVMVTAMPIFGLNQGAQPIIGYNYGAEKFHRVRHALKTAVLAATGIVLAGFTVAMFFPDPVLRLFSRDNPAMVELGAHAMRVSMAMLPLIGFQVICASYFQAVGKPAQAMLLMLSRQVLLLIPAVLILPRFFGLDGVWAALPTADFGSSLLTAVCFAAELRHLHRRAV